MNCQQVVELVTAYLEGTLGPDDRVAFEEHLRLCPGCDRYLAQFRTTISLLGGLPAETISDQARSSLLEAFGHWRRDRS